MHGLVEFAKIVLRIGFDNEYFMCNVEIWWQIFIY